MAFKAQDASVLSATLTQASDEEIAQQINALIDRKLLLTLARIGGVADQADVSALIQDPDVQAEGKKLKDKVAELMYGHEQLVAAVAKRKLEAERGTDVKTKEEGVER